MRGGNSLDIINEHIAAKRFAEAKAALVRELAKKPSDDELIGAMSYVLLRLGEFVKAEYFSRRLTEQNPADAQARHNLGTLLLQLNKLAEAERVLRKALELNPSQAMSRHALAGVCMVGHRYATARDQLEQAHKGAPTDTKILAALAMAHQQCGDVEKAVPLMHAAKAMRPDDIGLCGGLASMLNYAPGVEAAEIAAEHRRYGDLMHRVVAAPARPRVTEKSGGKLRVGVVSPDFQDHAVMKFFRPIVGHADRSRVEFVLYHAGTGIDDVTAWLKSKAVLFRQVAHEPHKVLAAIVAADHLDVLVDLAGHTHMHRLPVFAFRPAPVQVTYLGYPNSTGLTTMDARFTDSITDPVGTEEHCREQLIRLDPCVHCFTPPAAAPDVSVAPCEQGGSGGGEGGAVFGCFGALLKHNQGLYELWARLLKESPRSSLILKHVGTKQEEIQRSIRDRFVALGIEGSRIDVRPPSADPYSGYADVDVLLDTFPYHGTTTTCEALWMGVPVVTLAGNTTASRVGVSLLSAVGLNELIAKDEGEYVSIAAGLARDPARVGAYRRALRERMRASALCDGPGLAKRFVDALFTLHKQIADQAAA